MRAVIVVDRSFARRETAMLTRLEIGLVDEGYRVVHAMPVAALASEPTGLYSTSVGYVDTGLPFTLRSRVAALLETLEALADKQGDKAAVSVVHALGGGAWPVAIELARQTGAAAVLELDRASLLGQAVALVPPKAGPRRETVTVTPLFTVPDDLLRQALLQRAPRAQAKLARWGVHVPAHRQARGASPSVVLLVERGDSRSAVSVLEALAAIAAEAPDLLLFAAVEDGRHAPLWRVARRLGLLAKLSLIPEMEARREPVLQMDTLVLPDASGAQHSLVLDAMAAGLAVAAAPDPLVESLIDGRTARLTADTSRAAWEAALRDVVLDAEKWSLLGASAREYIRASRPVVGHIAATIDGYREAVRLREADLAPARGAA